MKKIYQKLVESVSEFAKYDLLEHKDKKVAELFIKAFNKYFEEENNSNLIIYNIDEQESLVKAVINGLTASKIVEIKKDNRNFVVYYFDPDSFESIDFESLLKLIANSMEELIENVLLYAIYCDEYKPIYERYFISQIEESN